jgi:hypothetical protein
MSTYYMLHPVSAPTREGVQANLERAERWARWLMDSLPDHEIIAPWMLYVKVLDDHNKEHRARGMRDGLRLLRRGIAHSIIIAGGTVSSGMADEIEVSRSAGVKVIDLVELGPEPPAEAYPPTHPILQPR